MGVGNVWCPGVFQLLGISSKFRSAHQFHQVRQDASRTPRGIARPMTTDRTLRSLTLDSWKSWELKAMYVGGNDKARKFFRMQGVRDLNGQAKYSTKAARLYKKRVRGEYERTKTPPTSPSIGPASSSNTTLLGGDKGLDAMLSELGVSATRAKNLTDGQHNGDVGRTSTPNGTFSLSAAISSMGDGEICDGEEKAAVTLPPRPPNRADNDTDEKSTIVAAAETSTGTLEIRESNLSSSAEKTPQKSRMLSKLMRKSTVSPSLPLFSPQIHVRLIGIISLRRLTGRKAQSPQEEEEITRRGAAWGLIAIFY